LPGAITCTGPPVVGVIGNPTIAYYPAPHLGRLKALRAGAGGAEVDAADAMPAIRTVLERPDLQVVYFYCHGDVAGTTPRLLVGSNGFPLSHTTFATWQIAWPSNPLVFVNGCDTVTYTPENLTSLALTFRTLSAAGVVGTEVKVFPTLARWFGEEFLQRFLNGMPVGEVMRELRLELLNKANPLGLAYTCYALAGLRLVDTRSGDGANPAASAPTIAQLGSSMAAG
jgi:hypothetical protein